MNLKLITILIFSISFQVSNAQFGKKLMKKLTSENTDEKVASDSTDDKSKSDRSVTAVKYSEVKAYDNPREQEKQYYNVLYKFSSSSPDRSADKDLDSALLVVEERNQKDKENLKSLAKDFPNLKYRRSSLYTLMVLDTTREHWNIIANAFGNTDLPQKFNDHNVGPYLIKTKARGKDNVKDSIEVFLREESIAKRLVARWFNRDETGGFDINLVAERGFYSASEIDIEFAKQNKRGEALLADAGEELIKNTFVVVNDYEFLSVEEATEKISEGSNLASKAGIGKFKKINQISKISSVVVQGYAVFATTYLYRLDWNDSSAAVFYSDYWSGKESVDQDKVDAFEKEDLFSLYYVGKQAAFQIVPSFLKSRSYPELIEIATIKATDKTVAKLQRQYPEFQIKTPLYSIDPLTAKIGKKEGITKKTKFEVLEQVLDKDGKTQYKRRAILKVDPEKIWDNTYLAEEEAISKGEEIQKIDATYFTTGNVDKLYKGMLIKQIK